MRNPLRTGGPVNLWFEAHPRAYDALNATLLPVNLTRYYVRYALDFPKRRRTNKRFIASLTPQERKEMNL